MKITKDMGIVDAIRIKPDDEELMQQLAMVFRNYGMGCIGCIASQYENIEQGCSAHGINADDLVADLNKVLDGAAN